MKATLAAIFVLSIWLFAARAKANDTVYYYYNDAQGSPVAVADANGNVVETTEYSPYGQTLNRPVHDGPGYTGHEEDSATGLTYMQQRYYDPQSGQFTSTDPVLPDGGTGESFNRYAYAADNPYRFVDPDGRAPDTDFGLGAMAESFGDHPEATEPLVPVAMVGAAIMAAPVAIAAGAVALANLPATTAIVNTAAEVLAGDALGGASLTAGAGALTATAHALGDDATTITRSAIGIGEHAGESIAARSASREFTTAERAKINDIGSKTGCHTCGATTPGTKSGNFVPDHQPATALNPSGNPQRLLPHCIHCSRQQGLEIARKLKDQG